VPPVKFKQDTHLGFQGLDISDIKLVIQWRATCKLTTLWQRFGRAARNKDLEGTAILFAEKDHFDDERAAKQMRKEQCKRKALKSVASPRPAKRMNMHELTTATILPEISHSGENADEEESDNELAPLLNRDVTPCSGQWVEAMEKALRDKRQSNRVEKRQKRDLDVGMDYLINADGHTGCRRKVFDTYFDNTTSGKSCCSE